MMLGRVDPQGSLLEPGLLFGDLVTRGSFHDKLAACGHELISDDDFVGLYALNRGRQSIPPSLMMRSLLLAVKDDTSDRESARRSRVDLDWKHAPRVPSDSPGIGTTFSLFRSRVVLHQADQASLTGQGPAVCFADGPRLRASPRQKYRPMCPQRRLTGRSTTD